MRTPAPLRTLLSLARAAAALLEATLRRDKMRKNSTALTGNQSLLKFKEAIQAQLSQYGLNPRDWDVECAPVKSESTFAVIARSRRSRSFALNGVANASSPSGCAIQELWLASV